MEILLNFFEPPIFAGWNALSATFKMCWINKKAENGKRKRQKGS